MTSSHDENSILIIARSILKDQNDSIAIDSRHINLPSRVAILVAFTEV